MLDQEQIDNWEDDARIFDAVNARILKGTTKHREMTAGELMPYVRTAIRLQWRMAELLKERERLSAEAMEATADPMR